MAAGFTIRSDKIDEFRDAFQNLAQELISPDLLERTLTVDAEVEFSDLTHQLINSLTHLSPFGIGNPHPVFATSDVSIRDVRTVGADGKHLKLFLEKDGISFSAIGFGMGSIMQHLSSKRLVSIAYAPESSIWNGNERTELKLRDIRLSPTNGQARNS
jgi:single-stranded-DNA-specific exonuclease